MEKQIGKSEIEINGIKYVPKGSNVAAKPKGKMPYVIARTYSAGVFAGYLAKRAGQEVTLKDARRIWYWEGAASLSQLSQEGTKTPNKCKIPIAVSEVLLLQTIEILQCTRKAQESIELLPIWSGYGDGSGDGYGSGEIKARK